MSTLDQTNKQQLPQLETFDRMLKLPVVETAWSQGHDAYDKVKNYNALINWAFTTTEGAVQRTAAVAAPLIHKLDVPIHIVDRTIVKGIDKLETTAPIIKEQPQKIYQQTKTRVMTHVQPHLDMVQALRTASQERATTWKDVSMQKANQVLSTQYGTMAVNGVDSSAALAEKLLDYCFPATGKDVEDNGAPISVEQNPLLHTIQTVGQLSNKISRRVYHTVLRQVQELRKHEIQDYVNGLITVLRLNQYLNLLKPKPSPAVDEDKDKNV